jgi:hypothetical protein
MKVTFTRDELAEIYIAESWLCVDCGVNTSPGSSSRAEVKAAFAANGGEAVEIEISTDDSAERFTVRDVIWAAAGMEPTGGCLCIGCLERRLGRRLKPKDFLCDDTFNDPRMPASQRLRKRRKDRLR